MVFDRLGEAEAARARLVANGVPREDVRIVSREDEAGPVQGNFTVGDGRPDVTGDPYDNARKVLRGTALLEIHIHEDTRPGVLALLGVPLQ